MTETHMDPQEFCAIHDASGMTANQLCVYLRIADRRSISRYRMGTTEVSGPVSKLMEQLQAINGKGE